MPLFLHQRDAHERFLPILKRIPGAQLCNVVVHCFTGTKDELLITLIWIYILESQAGFVMSVEVIHYTRC